MNMHITSFMSTGDVGVMMMPGVTEFYWYVTPEDFDDNLLRFNLSAGRLRHRWVPTSVGSAQRFLREAEEAEGLRLANDRYIIVKITLAEEIPNLSMDYPNAVVPGMMGAVLRVPITGELATTPSRKAQERGVELPDISFNTKATWVVETQPRRAPQSLQMGLMSAAEIFEMSTVEIISAGAFQVNEAADDETPIRGGVQDLRMGAFEDSAACEVCNLSLSRMDSSNSCQGHFGRVVLHEPIPKLQYLGTMKNAGIKSFPILNTLNSICLHCSRYMLPQGTLDSYADNVQGVFNLGKRNTGGFREVRNMMRSSSASAPGPFYIYHGSKPEDRKTCPHCDQFSPTLEFNHTQATFYFNQPDERYRNAARNIDFNTAYIALANIIDEDCKFLGLDPAHSRPEDLFFKVMPVSPNSSRPTLSLPGKKMKDLNDLTKLYQDVVHANERLRNSSIKGQSTAYNRRMLYLSVSRVYDNQNKKIGSGGTTQERGYGGSERAVSYKGIKNRLEGKRGRFRNNLQSKYVNNVSYSTITPDAALAIDEIGVPKQVAMICTVTEKVTTKNLDRLKMAVLNGRRTYPGATGVYMDGDAHNNAQGNLYRASESTAERLVPGMVVKRHIVDGDTGLFNRAPSLHRQSILAFRSKVVETKSLSMNPTVCIPFNADYDGDAAKFHFVQSEEAISEARRLMALDKNIIHARYGKLTVATDQDQTSGLYLLSHTDKRRKGEWNPLTGLGYTLEGIPYISKSLALSCYTYVFSEIRGEKELKSLYLSEKKVSTTKMPPFEEWKRSSKYRTVDSLPESDYSSPDGTECYTGRAIFSHLFDVLDCQYVSATFTGNTPAVNEDGLIKRKPDGGKIKERVIVYQGKLISGTLEKDSFGEGGSSLAPAFIYHEGYEAGQAKLVEYIEMVTRLGYAGHRVIGYTMGISDVNVYKPETLQKIDDLYDKYSSRIEKTIDSWYDKSFVEKATASDKVDAILDPMNYIEEKIFNLASEYEDLILAPIEDEQGSGNSMQIAVRSKARGKDQNVRQMGGSFGIVLVGGKRIVHGVSANRAMPHFPLVNPKTGELYPMNHPRHTGFVKSGYASGMSPTEYWLTSSAGRRSTVESGQGQISTSGYLERKMIKAFEPVVVNDRKQVVNVRTGRIINPLVGDDGLAPYHIRGSDDKELNGKGHTITLQPLLMEFNCKHDKPLEQAHSGQYLEHQCLECSKGSDISKFETELSGLLYAPSSKSIRAITDLLQSREMYAADLRKMGKKFVEYYNDSICRTGEAIGATAGGCLGEPATQSALRSFHFAGKMSFQGSVDRLKQMLESPMMEESIKSPQTKVPLRADYNTEAMANKLATVCRRVEATKIIDVIEYDVERGLISVQFNRKTVEYLGISKSTNILQRQIMKSLRREDLGLGSVRAVSEALSWDSKFIVAIPFADSAMLLKAKEAVLSTPISGITQATSVSVIEQDGRYSLDIRHARNATLNAIVDQLHEYLEVEAIETNNLGWIYEKFGLEAMLWMFHQELDFQMNGPGGVGEYDVRYIRMICDLMGEEGRPMGLGPSGIGSTHNYSALSAASLENVPVAMMGSSIMGNRDELRGPAEAIVSGAIPMIGDYAPKTQ